jgi:galactokinase
VPDAIARAPGRINLIGEHVDYNDGLVLPFAINLDVVVCARRRAQRTLNVTSLEKAERASIHLDARTRPAGWAAYAAGVAALLELQQGADLVVASDVSEGAGLASSAAFEVAVALALLALQGRSMAPADVAQLCRQAELEWAGVRCGVMDQFAVLLGQEAHALLLDCRTLEYEHVAIPESARFAIADTGNSRKLAASAYNTRVHECLAAAQQLGVNSLRDVTSVSAADVLPVPLNNRARHVISEIERTRRTAAALRTGDLEQCGSLMNASHESLRRDYDVSSAALDTLVERARTVPGVLGARLTGAGFGGHAIALTAPLALRRLRSEWSALRAVAPAGGAAVL